jgi:hypothetical protein
MTNTMRTVSSGLTYAGALPFWLLLVAPDTVAGLNAVDVFLAYGAVIASFMAGTLWGSAQMGKAGLGITIASNVLALIAFATLLIPLPVLNLIIQLVVFGLLYAADATVFSDDVERHWYLRLRQRITALVGVAYVIMLVEMVAFG